MRRIIAAVFVSLDGVMQAPGGPQEDPAGGFRYGGWVFPYFDEAGAEAVSGLFARPFDLLLGRKTYEIFAAYWPYAAANDPIGGAFNRVTKYVASRSRPTLDWENSELLGADVVASLTELKTGDGPDLLIQGSSNLIQTLQAHGLIDEFSLMVFPVVLGRGKRLFEDGAAPGALKLISATSFPTGVIRAKYEPAGAVRTGSFAQDEPSAAEIARRKKLD